MRGAPAQRQQEDLTGCNESFVFRFCLAARQAVRREVRRLDGGGRAPHAQVRWHIHVPGDETSAQRQGRVEYTHARPSVRSDFTATVVNCQRVVLQSKSRLFCQQLRLLYEGNPMAFIIQEAGGVASNGHIPILQIQPTALHQRTPVFMGSKDDVNELLAMFKSQ